jgi:thiol-disulfide isomerase/thioredoxin
MTETQNQPNVSRKRPFVLAAAALVLVAGAALLYGMGGLGGKKIADSGQCAEAKPAAARMTPLARGEVAAMAVASHPKPAVDISFLDKDGRRHALSEFRGRTVLLNLWATWCVPCRQEMPALDALQAERGGKDFEVVAVDIDTSHLERRQAFREQAGIKSLAFYADPSSEAFQKLKEAGKVLGLPTSFIIGPDGCELGVMAGPAPWNEPDALKMVDAALGRS